MILFTNHIISLFSLRSIIHSTSSLPVDDISKQPQDPIDPTKKSEQNDTFIISPEQPIDVIDGRAIDDSINRLMQNETFLGELGQPFFNAGDALLDIGGYKFDPKKTNVIKGKSGIQFDLAQITGLMVLQAKTMKAEEEWRNAGREDWRKAGDPFQKQQRKIIQLQHDTSPRIKEIENLKELNKQCEQRIRKGEKLTTDELKKYIENDIRITFLDNAMGAEEKEILNRLRLEYYINKAAIEGLNQIDEVNDFGKLLHQAPVKKEEYCKESGMQSEKRNLLKKIGLLENEIRTNASKYDNVNYEGISLKKLKEEQYYSLIYDQFKFIESGAHSEKLTGIKPRPNETLRAEFSSRFYTRGATMPCEEVLEYLSQERNFIGGKVVEKANDPEMKVLAGELIELAKKGLKLKKKGEELSSSDREHMKDLGKKVMGVDPKDIRGINFDGEEFISGFLPNLNTTGSSFIGTKFHRGTTFNGSVFSNPGLINSPDDIHPYLIDPSQRSDFTLQDLEDAEFQGCKGAFCIFEGANLRHTNFTDGEFMHGLFSDADMGLNANGEATILTRGKFNQAIFINTILKEAIANETDFSEGYFYNTNLTNLNKGLLTAPKTKFSGASIMRSSLRNSDLRGADLTEVFIGEKSDLSNCNLHDANLTNALIVDSNLNTTKFNKKSNLTRAGIINCKLQFAEFIGTIMTNCHLTGSDVKGTTFDGVNLTRGNLSGIKADSNTKFTNKCNLTGVNLSFAELIGTHFTDSNLTAANLRGAQADRANFSEGKLIGADLSSIAVRVQKEITKKDNQPTETKIVISSFIKANFSNAYLTLANLDGGRFDGANFSGAQLIEANLRNGVFKGANFKGADLSSANLQGADLSGIKFDDETCFKGAIYDGETILPGCSTPEERAAFAKKKGLVHVDQIAMNAIVQNAKEAEDRMFICLLTASVKLNQVGDLADTNQEVFGAKGGWFGSGIGPDYDKCSRAVRESLRSLRDEINTLEEIAKEGYTHKTEEKFNNQYKKIFGRLPGEIPGLTNEEKQELLKTGFKPDQIEKINKDLKNKVVKDFYELPGDCELKKAVKKLQGFVDNKNAYNETIAMVANLGTFMGCCALSAETGFTSLLAAPVAAAAAEDRVVRALGRIDLNLNTGQVTKEISEEELRGNYKVNVKTGYIALPLCWIGGVGAKYVLSKGGKYIVSKVTGQPIAKLALNPKAVKAAELLISTEGHAQAGATFSITHHTVGAMDLKGADFKTALGEGCKAAPDGAIFGIVLGHGIYMVKSGINKGIHSYQRERTLRELQFQFELQSKKIIEGLEAERKQLIEAAEAESKRSSEDFYRLQEEKLLKATKMKDVGIFLDELQEANLEKLSTVERISKAEEIVAETFRENGLFAPKEKLPKVVFDVLPKGQLGEYRWQRNEISLNLLLFEHLPKESSSELARALHERFKETVTHEAKHAVDAVRMAYLPPEQVVDIAASEIAALARKGKITSRNDPKTKIIIPEDCKDLESLCKDALLANEKIDEVVETLRFVEKFLEKNQSIIELNSKQWGNEKAIREAITQFLLIKCDPFQSRLLKIINGRMTVRKPLGWDVLPRQEFQESKDSYVKTENSLKKEGREIFYDKARKALRDELRYEYRVFDGKEHTRTSKEQYMLYETSSVEYGCNTERSRRLRKSSNDPQERKVANAVLETIIVNRRVFLVISQMKKIINEKGLSYLEQNHKELLKHLARLESRLEELSKSLEGHHYNFSEKPNRIQKDINDFLNENNLLDTFESLKTSPQKVKTNPPPAESNPSMLESKGNGKSKIQALIEYFDEIKGPPLSEKEIIEFAEKIVIKQFEEMGIPKEYKPKIILQESDEFLGLASALDNAIYLNKGLFKKLTKGINSELEQVLRTTFEDTVVHEAKHAINSAFISCLPSERVLTIIVEEMCRFARNGEITESGIKIKAPRDCQKGLEDLFRKVLVIEDISKLPEWSKVVGLVENFIDKNPSIVDANKGAGVDTTCIRDSFINFIAKQHNLYGRHLIKIESGQIKVRKLPGWEKVPEFKEGTEGFNKAEKALRDRIKYDNDAYPESPLENLPDIVKQKLAREKQIQYQASPEEHKARQVYPELQAKVNPDPGAKKVAADMKETNDIVKEAYSTIKQMEKIIEEKGVSHLNEHHRKMLRRVADLDARLPDLLETFRGIDPFYESNVREIHKYIMDFFLKNPWLDTTEFFRTSPQKVKRTPPAQEKPTESLAKPSLEKPTERTPPPAPEKPETPVRESSPPKDPPAPLDINTLIAGLNEKDSEKFLKNIEQLLKRIDVKELLVNDKVLAILFERYTVLGKCVLHPMYLNYNDINEKPLEAFRGLEESLKDGKIKFNYYEKPNSSRTLNIARNIPPNTIIEASYGGGLRFITGFLLGKQKGYPLEKGGLGIQMSPNFTGRDESYANRIIGRNFDSPAILRFSIEAQHLYEANNGYESGFTPEYLDKVSNIELINLKTKEKITAKNIKELAEKLRNQKE